jgi:bile acid-coenzyme A ligase
VQLTEPELREYLNDHLVRYKIPRSIEFVDTPLRDDAGKVRRSALREDRL